MTQEDLKTMKEEQDKNKFKSRTFWLTVTWVAMIPLAIITQSIVAAGTEIPVSTIATFAGYITIIYIGGNKGTNIAEMINLNRNKK
jgi:hypothetical protein